MEPNKLTLIDKYPRNVLAEARNYGISFAFCKKDGNAFTTVGPASPCKDFLNDQIYSEATGKPFQAYGYHAKKEGIFEGQTQAYVAIYILPYFYGGEYPDQAEETKFMDEHHVDVAKFVRFFEDLLKIPQAECTTIEKVGKNQFIATIPIFWCQYTYLISLWSLLARVGLESAFLYDKQPDPWKVLDNCKTGDSMLVQGALPKLKKMIEGIVPKQDFSTPMFWHNVGIISFEFPS